MTPLARDGGRPKSAALPWGAELPSVAAAAQENDRLSYVGRRRIAMVSATAFLVVTSLFSLVYLQRGLTNTLFLCHVAAITVGLGVVVGLRVGLSPAIGGDILAVLLSFLLVVSELIDGGPSAANLGYFVIAPVGMVFLGGFRRGAIWLGIVLAILASLLVASACGLYPPYSRTDKIADALSPVVLTIVITCFAFSYDRYRDRMQEELKRARAAAEGASRVKSVLVATMSHELKTPMNGLLGMLRELERTRLTPEQAEILGVMAQASAALAHLVDDVLDLERIEAEELPLVRDVFAPATWLAEACAVLAPLAREKGLSLELRIADDVPGHVVGDKARTRQVLMNIIGNAVKFTPAGRVRVSLAARDEALELLVEDSGPGFEPTVLAHVFTPFARGKEEEAGAGLGLAISRRLVTAMCGSIEAYNADEGGARVRVTLPLPTAAPPVKRPSSTLVPRGHRVLIVEDNAVNQRVAVLMLRAAGAECEVANDGVEALERLRERDFDVVLMDCRMPRLDGFETTRQLRRLDAHRTTPVVAMTASTLAGDRAEATAAGMDDWLAKPLDVEELERVLVRFPPRGRDAS